MAEKQIGEVTDFFAHVSAASVKLSASLKKGDKIRIVGGENSFEQVVDSMQIDRKPVESAKKGQEVGILTAQKVHKGYKVYKL